MGTSYLIKEETLQNIADSIRQKTDEPAQIAVSDFADKILKIEAGADVSSTVNNLISVHNTATDSHSDIREAINGKLNTSELSNAINTALAQAKTSGEFDGADGEDGISVTVKSVSESAEDGGSNVVTFSDGKTITIKNGSKGATGSQGPKGDTGKVGISPTVSVEDIAGGHRVTITDKDGPKTFEVMDGKDGAGGSSGDQPDWNAAEGESGYVLNRTHWKEVGAGFVLENARFVSGDSVDGIITVENAVIFGGEEYKIDWNGTEYTCTSVEMHEDDLTLVLMGNIGALTGGESTGEPFIIAHLDGNISITPMDGESTWWISIYGKTEVIHELPAKYIRTAISDSEQRMKEYTDDKTAGAGVYSNIDISEGTTAEDGNEGLWSSINHSRGACSFHLTVLGQEYVFQAYPQKKIKTRNNDFHFTVFFEGNTSGYNVPGSFYCLHIIITFGNRMHYRLRKMYDTLV